MTTIFNFIGSLFGYVLWGIFYLVRNFGVAIFFFTLITRLIIFPSSLKQQRSMAANSRLQAKQRELKEKYGNNKQKYNEEVQKLYQREGVSPFGGCLSSLFPMLIMLGIYYTVINPIRNVLHIASGKITQLVEFINGVPGINVSNDRYQEMDILRIFSNPHAVDILKEKGLSDILSDGEISRLQDLSGGFKFLGLNLLDIPSTFALFASAIILIPIFVLITSIGSQLLTMRIQRGVMPAQQGCMRVVMLLLPLISVYISFVVPGAVGFYWICSTIIGFGQTVIMTKFFSPMQITARGEAAHVALLEQKEKLVPYNYQPRAPQAAVENTGGKGNASNKGKKKK